MLSEDLIKAAKNNNQRAFKMLFDKHYPMIFSFIDQMVKNKTISEDLTIESIQKAFKNIQGYKEDYAFNTWLYRIAKNHTIDYIRRTSKRIKPLSLSYVYNLDNGEETIIEVEDNEPGPIEKMEKKERIDFVNNSINSLPSKYHQIVILRYLEEFSYDEIAEILGRPLGTVKAQLFRCRELLLEVMKHKIDQL